ncbi:MAG: hypothetical protein IJD70_05610 [Clostridia bacterium]|nr:hypothetical protein [Clostridia bacterium]
MKRIFALALCVLMLLPMIFIAPVSAADAIEIGYSSPAICTDAGKSVDLTTVGVQFTYGGEVTPASAIVWKDGSNTVTSYTPAEKGVYPLTATAGGKSKTIYVVAKNANETEYVLYEDDYSVAPDLSQFRVIQQPAGTTFGYDEAEGAIYLDTSNDGANHMRVLLPKYLDAFGDAIYSARVKITKQTSTSRFGAMIFRLQDPSGKTIPYMQTAFRYNIAADNGLEIAERTSADKWSVTQKGPVSGISGGSYFDVTANFCGSVSTSTVNGKTYLTEKNTPYSSGAMGLQVRGARLTVDSIKITVNPESKPSKPEPQLHDTRDPESNIALEPALITEVKTSAELKALETTLPAIAVFDAAYENNVFGITLDGKFASIADVSICERVVPAFRVDSSSEALALGQYAKNLELCDVYVIASDPKFITEARSKCDMLYGMVDAASLSYTDDEDLRGQLIKCGARGAILPADKASREFVSYLQDRYLAVWQAVTEKDISAVSAINNGVLGLITPDVKATEACFTKYYGKNTLVRTPEIIGHRGVPSKAQENTVEGSVEAFKLGATMVENDIYLMRDGNIVVMHDGTIDRTTNGEGKTVDQTAETIKNYVVDGNANAPTAPIPLLKDYFEKFKGTGEVLVVELKSSDTKIGAPLAKLIKEYGMERQVVIIAFNKDMIASIRRADPDISVNFLTSGITANESRSLEVAKEILGNVIPINTAYSPSHSAGTLGPNLYADLAVRGVTLWNWTVNDEAKFNSFFISGIRGITTNYSQWAGTYVEDFAMNLSADGVIELKAMTYNGGSSSTKAAELVVIGGTGTYENGVVTLSEGAEGFFFRLKKSLSNGTAYYVVTPVMLSENYHPASPLPETTVEATTDAPEASTPVTDPVTDPSDEPAHEEKNGCGSMISLALIALIPAAVLVIKKKEN